MGEDVLLGLEDSRESGQPQNPEIRLGSVRRLHLVLDHRKMAPRFRPWGVAVLWRRRLDPDLLHCCTMRSNRALMSLPVAAEVSLKYRGAFVCQWRCIL